MKEEYTTINFHPKRDHIPLHVGLIPDGTGRWSLINKIGYEEAYTYAMGKIIIFLEYFFSKGAINASVYCSSIQNLNRPDKIKNAFCKSQELFINNQLKDFLQHFPAKVVPVGELSALPKNLKNSLLDIKYQTVKNEKFVINLCVAYNPIEEIIQAVKTSSSDNFLDNLWVEKPLDLVIRTSGANLLSNFLPVQCGYARLYWIEKLFPDVVLSDYQYIFEEFIKLNRKYGD